MYLSYILVDIYNVNVTMIYSTLLGLKILLAKLKGKIIFNMDKLCLKSLNKCALLWKHIHDKY
jgi:hypothetical protein